MRAARITVFAVVILYFFAAPARAVEGGQVAAAGDGSYVHTDGADVDLTWDGPMSGGIGHVEVNIVLPDGVSFHQRALRRAHLGFSVDNICIESVSDGHCFATGSIEVRVRWEGYGTARDIGDGQTRLAHVSGVLLFDGSPLASFDGGSGSLYRVVS